MWLVILHVTTPRDDIATSTVLGEVLALLCCPRHNIGYHGRYLRWHRRRQALEVPAMPTVSRVPAYPEHPLPWE